VTPPRGSSTALALLVGCALAGALRAAADGSPSPADGAADRAIPVRVLAVYPHDPEAFTQGLLWSGGHLYESTGLYGRSSVREVALESGRVMRRTDLPAEDFGEGLALVGGRLIQLTWREERAHVWSLDGFEPIGDFDYRGEGWGLTFDGSSLIESDGSALLSFRSPADFHLERTLAVRRGGRAVPYLNELEWADGAVYANVWQSDELVRIDPASGEVTGTWDASGLLDPGQRARADVLNGIAWNPDKRVFYLTGKLWPSLFEVTLPEPPAH
jgi:glutaminyl-peptide cyclotransferase